MDKGHEARILHLTDPHLFANADGELRGIRTFASLLRVLEHYRGCDWRADCAVVTGDLIHDDSATAYARFRKALTMLDMPIHCLPGNHDVPDLMREACDSAPFSFGFRVTMANWLLASVDSCIAGSAGGVVGEAEIRRLGDAVRASGAEHVLVCMHHPPVPMGSAWLDSVGLDNGQKFLQQVTELGRVRGIVFGHVHQAYDAFHDSIRVLATPSTCRQFLPGSDQFAIDTRPPAYRRLTLTAEGDIDTEVIWVES